MSKTTIKHQLKNEAMSLLPFFSLAECSLFFSLFFLDVNM